MKVDTEAASRVIKCGRFPDGAFGILLNEVSAKPLLVAWFPAGTSEGLVSMTAAILRIAFFTLGYDEFKRRARILAQGVTA